MPVKRKIVAAAAALAVVGGAALAATFPANAETPSCGPTCVDVYGGIPAVLGHASFIIASYKQGQATGTPIILSDVSNVNPAEDFESISEDTVSHYFQAGLVSASVDELYGNDVAFELDYAPFGDPTLQCVGVGATATAGEQVTLQQCGVSAKTLWIADTSGSISQSLIPLINGSTQDGSHPLVLTYPLGASPDDQPRPVLYVSVLQTNTNGQTPYNQLWSELIGSQPRSDADLTFAQPAAVTADATNPSGAAVTYPLPKATDPDDTTSPAVVCTPASGSAFPIGTATVTCTATDRNDLNGPVHATFTVTVLGAAAQVAALVQAVRDNIAVLFAGIAQQQLSAGHPTLACRTLNQFIALVRLEFPASTAAPLIADAKRIQAVLGGCARQRPF